MTTEASAVGQSTGGHAGVLEYVHDTSSALAKVFAETDKVVMSFCCSLGKDGVNARRLRGWVSAMDEATLLEYAAKAGFQVAHCVPLNVAEDLAQKIFVFRRAALPIP